MLELMHEVVCVFASERLETETKVMQKRMFFVGSVEDILRLLSTLLRNEEVDGRRLSCTMEIGPVIIYEGWVTRFTCTIGTIDE